MSKNRATGGIAPLEEKVYQEFSGLNRRADKLNTPPNYYFDLINGYLRKDAQSGLGYITQRTGSSKLNTVALSGYGTNTEIRTVFEAVWNAGSKDIIIRAGTAWGKFDGVNSFPTLTGLTGRTDNVVGQCVMFQNNLIVADGGPMQKVSPSYTASILSADPAMPQDSTAVWVHSDKVWANSLSNPMKAYFSDTNNATTDTAWSDSGNAGFLDLSTVLPIGDRILGFRTMGGTTQMILVIITTQYLVLYLAGADPTQFALLKYINTTCLSAQAISYIGSDLIYAAQSMVTSIFNAYQNNDLEVNGISQWIDPYYRSQIANLSDPTTQVCAVFDHQLNHWYLTIGGTQTLVYSVDVQNFTGRWTYPFNIYSWLYRQNGTILSGSDGYVYTMNVGTDDAGTAIPWQLTMPALYFDLPNRFKKPVEFEALFQATASLSLTLTYYYDISTEVSASFSKTINIAALSSLWDVALWDVSFWDQVGNVLYNTPDLVGRGRAMFIQLSHSTLDALISMPWFVIRYNIEGRN